MREIKIVVSGSYDKKTGKIIIGDGEANSIPWSCKEDLKYFRKNTLNSVCIMGRKTFDSILLETNGKILDKRINVVLSSNPEAKSNYKEKFNHEIKNKNLVFLKDTTELEMYILNNQRDPICIIGGSRIYEYFLNEETVSEILFTEIKKNISVKNPIYFPNIPYNFEITEYTNNFPECVFIKYTLKNITMSICSYDDIYKNLAENILTNGVTKSDRTGTGTISVFGDHIKIDVSNYCPVLTTKWVAWKTCIKELLWFLRGETDAKILDSQGVKIWNNNTSREFLDKRNLNHYPEGELGPSYSWQIRRSGAEFPNKEGGVDQLLYIEDLLKNDPHSRRIMWNLWIPKDLEKMALTVCHNQIQLYTEDGGHLSMSVYIRSNDIFLGNPFNVFSYYVLLRLFCMRHNFLPKNLIFNIGDGHIYSNHIESITSQMKNSPRVSPKLFINEACKTKKWEEITISDFELIGYFPHPSIKADMAV